MESETQVQLKAIIVENARKGVFDSSPLISASHKVTCPNCSHSQNIVLIEYLKKGEFKLGKTEEIEAIVTEGIESFLEKEKFTPIVAMSVCDECNSPIEVRIINVEYLQTIIDRPKVSKTMYV